MFGIDFVHPDRAIAVATMSWLRMGPSAEAWSEATLRATTKAEFNTWFCTKIEAVAYDDGLVVFFERPKSNVVVAHPFVSPCLREREGAVRSLLVCLREAFTGLIVELHLCNETPKALASIVQECGFQNVGTQERITMRDETPTKPAAFVFFDKWRILL